MFSAITRLFTTRICMTCSKAVHRSKLQTHLRRHEAGRKQYFWLIMLAPKPGLGGIEEIKTLFRKRKDGTWFVSPTRQTERVRDNADYIRAVDDQLAKLNGSNDLPALTKRDIPNSDPCEAPLAPSPHTLLS